MVLGFVVSSKHKETTFSMFCLLLSKIFQLTLYCKDVIDILIHTIDYHKFILNCINITRIYIKSLFR